MCTTGNDKMTPKTINHSMTKYYTISILVWLRNWQECKINLTLNLLNEILLWYSDIIHSESEKKRQGFEIKSLDIVSQFRNRSRGFINCFGVHQAAFKVVMNHSEVIVFLSPLHYWDPISFATTVGVKLAGCCQVAAKATHRYNHKSTAAKWTSPRRSITLNSLIIC